MPDDDLPSAAKASQSELALARERVRGREEQVAFLQGQLDQERQRNAELVNELKAARERRGSWRQFWQGRRKWWSLW